ncbi:MAG: 4'-phosphopantetheinyl transferase superfamily protein [Mesorhizobium sp.]|nr:MAG: 4'-phosphopantetheinyl transferase superfamily protein [Mesorhizobium sp.]RWK57593.1 MAG: 4'-phosphopantetheinyl transferase superfamily protein [Mesorhizobium sp.]RWM41317.1 MAG: 4'-phosphopantetheinyl transferase superfamily protein [Mesorhizobium sp.]RWM44723.1 MAG: 4'-phosphopantetheinyl transferase superfamily protein [Mesorhizobium sp.]RWO22242.1 MAG: 4'-phosphopantetheinyl transferase superfamily protein [Mesorhizobium sp.]
MDIIRFHQPNILVGIRPIERVDEAALFDSEAAALGRAVAKVRRQSGAARIIARTLLGKVGLPPMPILKTNSGVPTWPAGIVGSLAHHDTVAAAAIADKNAIGALGIDIEPNEPLPDGLIDLIATPREQGMYDSRLLQRRDLFVLKEAIYKACFSLYNEKLGFHDVETDIKSNTGYVKKIDCIFSIELYISKDIIGLAYQH